MATRHVETTSIPAVPGSSGRTVRAPAILDGGPTVKGTRVPVRAIVLTHRLYPNVGRMLQAFPMVTEEDIQEALEFYDANRAEIDFHIAENEHADDL